MDLRHLEINKAPVECGSEPKHRNRLPLVVSIWRLRWCLYSDRGWNRGGHASASVNWAQSAVSGRRHVPASGATLRRSSCHPATGLASASVSSASLSSADRIRPPFRRWCRPGRLLWTGFRPLRDSAESDWLIPKDCCASSWRAMSNCVYRWTWNPHRTKFHFCHNPKWIVQKKKNKLNAKLSFKSRL